MKRIRFTAALIVLMAVTGAKAQFSVGADFVSNYVFRGVQQDAVHPIGSPNIQPALSYTKNGFTIGTWGSYSFSGGTKEVDLFLTYDFSDLFSVTFTDYNYIFSQSHFNYNSQTDHVLEATLAYGGVDAFPLSAAANLMFYGADKLQNGNQAYSTYIELGYPIASNVEVFIGASLFESLTYGTAGFGVTNLGIKAGKTIPVSQAFGLGVYGILGFNPNAKDAFLVAGISL